MPTPPPPHLAPPPRSHGFAADFRHFFLRGLAALLPTLITLWLVLWAWDFLWQSLGKHLITAITAVWRLLVDWGLLPPKPTGYIERYFENIDPWKVQFLGVVLAVVVVYLVGLLVGNLIGRTFVALAEMTVMRIPIIRAVYPAVKQITDYLLAERRGNAQFAQSRVVAVQPHERGIWSIGLVTGSGLAGLDRTTGQEMVTVFVPSSPTAFSGYVLVVPRTEVVDLPMTVEEAMRLLVSGGVLSATDRATTAAVTGAAPANLPSDRAPAFDSGKDAKPFPTQAT